MATMKEMIKAHIDLMCLSDAEFAKKVANPRKTFDNCIVFVTQQAQKYMQEHMDEFKAQGGYGGNVDNEVCYGWALHYYDETDLDIDMTADERRAKKEKEDAERKAKAQTETKSAPKKGSAKTATKKETKSAPKPIKTKSATELLKKAQAKAEKNNGKETKLSKSDYKSGNDCYDMFSEFFS